MTNANASVKTEVTNNIMLQMSMYLEKSMLDILQRVIEEQFVFLNMEKITTLPVEINRSTGARIGEIVQINRDDIDWQTGDVLICGEKGGRYRTIYLDEVARYYLRRYIDSRKDNDPALFVACRAPYTRLKISGLRNIIKQIAKREGMQCRVYPHKLRKTLGMNLKNSGVDLGSIQEILGHSNPAVTSRYYAESTPDTLRSVRKRAIA